MVYKIYPGSLINAWAWNNINIAIIEPAMATKRKVCTVTNKLQAVEVAVKTSKEAVAMSAKNSSLTVSRPTNTMNTPYQCCMTVKL